MMKEIRLQGSFLEFDSPAELPAGDLELLNRAKQAMHSSYSPYSKYKVGAAVLLGNGEVFTGSNQENMAFPSGLCAERVAVFSAASAFPGVAIKAVAITSSSDEFPVSSPVTPCGACRQAMIEYEILNRNKIRLILSGESGKVRVVEGIHTLLPLYFFEERLGK
jgi:cytidine deaminase